MSEQFIELLSYHDQAMRLDKDRLVAGDQCVSVRNGIPRFTPDHSYSSGNFSRLREEHATLQLDSVNGTTDRLDTILDRTNWDKEFFKGKLILECGCGAGPDTEVLLSLGAHVVSVDLAGTDIAKANVKNNENAYFVQASIMDLPLQRHSFDIVFCHRVLQHTPNPEATLDHILQFVKQDGAVFVHSYARTWAQMFRWKYALLPLSRKMDSERLYNLIKAYAPFAYKLTNGINRLPGGLYFNHVFIPFLNKRHLSKFKSLSDEQILEYSIHDTFDALSPAYDSPLSANRMRDIAKRHLTKPFEIDERRTVTLLRTVV
jgi:SAM-dependent methyltransferase